MERANLNLDKLGLTLTKRSPELFDVNLSDYQGAVDWIVGFTGMDITTATLDPYTERWAFYGESGLLFALPHDIIQRIHYAIRQRGAAPAHARQASGYIEAGRGSHDDTARADDDPA